MSLRAYSTGLSAPQIPAQRAPRVTLLEIDERPTSVDPILAQIFRTMRASTGLPIAPVARQLGISTDVLAALEAGHIRVFRTPADAVRTIEAYGRLVAVDVRSIIERLLPQISDETAPLQRLEPQPRRLAVPGPVTAPPARLAATLKPQKLVKAAAAVEPALALKQARRKPRRAIRWLKRGAWCGAAVIALAAGTVMVAESHPRMASVAAQQLPSGMVRSLRATVQRVAGLFGGDDAKLRWIEVADPRSRKADRLP